MFDNLHDQSGPGWTLHHAECVERMNTMPPDTVDAILTDPPYHLTSIKARYGNTAIDRDGTNETRARNRSDAMARLAGGFMGKAWDGGDVAFRVETWQAAWRVLKPGGYIMAFASSRGYHRMAVAIEDAGFIIHPLIGWVFGNGFPKATNPQLPGWEGWYYGGQVRKPALEPICVAQKPFSEKNGALNILRWGVGAVNIDGCRVGEYVNTTPSGVDRRNAKLQELGYRPGAYQMGETIPHQTATGRWPANLIHDGSPEVLALFPDTGPSRQVIGKRAGPLTGTFGEFSGQSDVAVGHDDAGGSAARFFECYPITYHAKASKADRVGSRHPTVKPLGLIRSYVRHVTPPGGTVLDPFAGTGTTLRAAVLEDRRAIGIEADAASVIDTVWRMHHAQSK